MKMTPDGLPGYKHCPYHCEVEKTVAMSALYTLWSLEALLEGSQSTTVSPHLSPSLLVCIQQQAPSSGNLWAILSDAWEIESDI